MRTSDIIRILAIMWFTETLIAVVLYTGLGLVKNNRVYSIFLLKTFHFIYYYWLLFIIYFFREKQFNVRFFSLANSIVFIFISIVISLILKGIYKLFLDYSFVCNFLAILLAPYLLKKLNSKLPTHLRIY